MKNTIRQRWAPTIEKSSKITGRLDTVSSIHSLNISGQLIFNDKTDLKGF